VDPVVIMAPGVAGRYVYYNNSTFDRRDPTGDAVADDAIATDKAALRPGQSATFANVTSYSRGINGVMIDVFGRDAAMESVVFETADSPFATTWTPAPPTYVDRRGLGEGVNGSDRVAFFWPDGAIVRKWLRVTVPAGAGAPTLPDVFWFGNLPGEAGVGNGASSLTVGGADVIATRNAISPRPVGVTSPFDYNRDSRVNAADLAMVRRAVFSTLAVPAPPPAAVAALPRRRPPGVRDMLVSASESVRGT
jgi:hypothetical protein